MPSSSALRTNWRECGWTRVAIFADKTPYGESGLRDVEAAMASHQLKPVHVERFDLGVKDLTAGLQRARQAGANVIFSYTVGPENAVIARSRVAAGMSAPLVRHGWTIAFQPQLFARQYAELKAEVKRLKQELDPQSFVQHPQVKLLAAVMEGIKERIAADPYASRFALSGPLRRYGRLKGLGLPDRYRLFFRPFEADGQRLLLILWLGFPRKEGDRNDCYAVFSRLVQRVVPRYR